jgi:hypothetical protein
MDRLGLRILVTLPCQIKGTVKQANRKAAGRFVTFQPGSKAQSIAPFYFAGMNLMDKYDKFWQSHFIC